MAIPTDTTPSLATDKTLRPFLAPSFDPADYLNATLPAWTPSARPNPSTTTTTTTTQPTSLTDLNTQTQTLLSQLSAQLTRLSTHLTKLTDDILRSGGRLAYEVEILRGETGTLSDVLLDGLAADLARFVPEGLLKPATVARRRSSASRLSVSTVTGPVLLEAETEPTPQKARTQTQMQGGEPKTTAEAVTRLRTLALVRDRLESVVKVFGGATEWTVASSEVSMRNTFISVAGPEAQDTEEREKRGKAWVEGKKRELEGVLRGSEGYEGAMEKVDDLEVLAEVWRGEFVKNFPLCLCLWVSDLWYVGSAL